MGKAVDRLPNAVSREIYSTATVETAIREMQESRDWSMLTSAAGRVRAFQAGMVFARRTSDKLVTHCCTQCAHQPAAYDYEQVGKFTCSACGVGLVVVEREADDLLRDAHRLLKIVMKSGSLQPTEIADLVPQVSAYFKARGEAV